MTKLVEEMIGKRYKFVERIFKMPTPIQHFGKSFIPEKRKLVWS